MHCFSKLNDEFITRGNDSALIVGMDDKGHDYKIGRERHSVSCPTDSGCFELMKIKGTHQWYGQITSSSRGSVLDKKDISESSFKTDEEETFTMVGRDKSRMNQPNVVDIFIDLETTRFLDLTRAKAVMAEIKAILKRTVEGTVYEPGTVTCYLPETMTWRTQFTKILKVQAVVVRKPYLLRKSICRPHQLLRDQLLREQGQTNTCMGRKADLLEMDMVGEMLWHVWELKKMGSPRKTLMSISGHEWLQVKLEEGVLRGYTLLKDIPPSMIPIPMYE